MTEPGGTLVAAVVYQGGRLTFATRQGGLVGGPLGDEQDGGHGHQAAPGGSSVGRLVQNDHEAAVPRPMAMRTAAPRSARADEMDGLDVVENGFGGQPLPGQPFLEIGVGGAEVDGRTPGAEGGHHGGEGQDPGGALAPGHDEGQSGGDEHAQADEGHRRSLAGTGREGRQLLHVVAGVPELIAEGDEQHLEAPPDGAPDVLRTLEHEPHRNGQEEPGDHGGHGQGAQSEGSGRPGPAGGQQDGQERPHRRRQDGQGEDLLRDHELHTDEESESDTAPGGRALAPDEDLVEHEKHQGRDDQEAEAEVALGDVLDDEGRVAEEQSTDDAGR